MVVSEYPSGMSVVVNASENLYSLPFTVTVIPVSDPAPPVCAVVVGSTLVVPSSAAAMEIAEDPSSRSRVSPEDREAVLLLTVMVVSVAWSARNVTVVRSSLPFPVPV